MHRLWLIFAQAVTISVAALFVISSLRPDWLAVEPQVDAPTIVELREAATPAPRVGAPEARVSYADAAARVLPSVVFIATSKDIRSPRNPLLDDPIFRHFFGDRLDNRPERRSSGLGSGVIVSGDGYILTNNHVVESADDIEVSLNDGRTYHATEVGRDPESDLAVLRISSNAPLPAITFAQPDSLSVGDVVLAIGNPFGVGQTVTMGIVSALGRSQLGINTFENFIQTDAAINPGNSGGALIDTNGHLVGINAAIFSRSGGSLGIGFAIPTSLAREVMEQIIRSGTVTRGWIGVEIQDMTPELAESFGLEDDHGALIAGVVRGGPADDAGMRPGDVLLAIDGRAIIGPREMLDVISRLPPGSRNDFHVRRSGRELDLGVVIGTRPARATARID
ncbi:MAG: Do family serine endopeptidase [Rhodocyclaceae bacterium]|nr:Do family serine endopeptidase [Rhodocyclaceae bacterium]